MALLDFLKKKRKLEKDQRVKEQKVTVQSQQQDPDKKDKEVKDEKQEQPKAIFHGKISNAQQIIISPHLTERTNIMMGLGKYVFKISRRANKISVRRAVEELYKVRVNSVHIINVPSKKRRRGRSVGRRPGYKKAIVTLHSSDTIEML